MTTSKYASKLEALQTCLLLWQELAKEGYETKFQAYHACNLSEVDLFDCPACEYAEAVWVRQGKKTGNTFIAHTARSTLIEQIPALACITKNLTRFGWWPAVRMIQRKRVSVLPLPCVN